MGEIDEFYKLIDRGREGNSAGLSLGLPKLEKYIEGLTPTTSYLIGAGSGVGKTTFIIYSFIYCPIMEDDKSKDVHFLYFSLEMTPAQILAKLISIYLYLHEGVSLSFADIFSRSKDQNGEAIILSDDNYELIKTCRPILEKFMDRITFVTGTLNAAKYVSEVSKYLKRFGEFNGDKYIPDNPNQILGIVVDHLNLVRASQGKSKKEEIDLISTYSVSFRNKCTIVSPINVMQLNRNANGQERLKQGLQEPDDSDLKETGSVFEDSMIALLLFNPVRAKLMTHRGYDIKQLGSNYRSIKCIKNRFGAADIAVGCAFYGEIGVFKELPKSSELTNYMKYQTPDWILLDDYEPTSVGKTKIKL